MPLSTEAEGLPGWQQWGGRCRTCPACATVSRTLCCLVDLCVFPISWKRKPLDTQVGSGGEQVGTSVSIGADPHSGCMLWW